MKKKLVKVKPKPIFASADLPIRASNLPNLFLCPQLFVDKTMEEFASSADADTGNLVHSGIQIYHTGFTKPVEIEYGINSEWKKKYPLGNPKAAYNTVMRYIARETKEQRGKIIATEITVKIKLQPASFDKTKEEIIITGHIDQIRKLGSDLHYVVDFKNGRKYGDKMQKLYAPQIAAYMVAAYEKYHTPIAGWIYRTQDLDRSDLPCWWDIGFDHIGARKLLDIVRTRIANIRNGAICNTPGDHCVSHQCKQLLFPGCITGVKTKEKKSSSSVPLVTVDELFRV